MATLSPPPKKPPEEPEYDAGHVPITEELDDSKHTMPNLGPMVIALVLVTIVVGAVAIAFRARPVASGRIDEAFAVDVTNQHTSMASIQLTLKNVSSKPINLEDVIVTLHTESGDYSDTMAPFSDFQRYLTAFPELRAHSIDGLVRGTKLQPGSEISGSVVVNFPVTREKFDTRRAISATVKFDGYTPMEIRR